MADTKISALTVLTAPAAGDLIPIVDISDTTMAASGTTKSVTQSVLLANHLPLAGGTMTGTITFTTGLQKFGGATSSFPALKRSGVELQCRLADDSDYAPLVSGSGFSVKGGINQYFNEGAAYFRSAGSVVFIGNPNSLHVTGSIDLGSAGYNYATSSITSDGAGLVALRNDTNATFTAHTLRVYGARTDASNYVRASLSSSATAVTLAAETAGTGADDLNIVLTPAGTGGVGIGTSPSYLLHVNNDDAGKPGASGLWTIVSDERIKTDIVPADLDRCYDIVKQVGLKHFGYKPGVYSDEQINDKHSLGWIAQDVQKVFGKAVSIKPFTLQTDIPDGTEEYEEQEFTVETVNKVETSIQVINGKPVQASKTTRVEEKTLLFDEVVVVDVAGDIVMVDGAPLTHKVPRMVTKTRPKVRREVIEDCLDLNGGQMNAALYGAVQCLMAKVEAQAVTIASLQRDA